MEILSPIYGKIIYQESDLIKFEKKISGFEHINNYIIREISEDSPFKIMQAIDDQNICFVIVSPFDVDNKYEIELNNDLIERIKINDKKDVILYSIVTLNSNPDKSTVNLKAPIVINTVNNMAEQFIVDKDQYKIKHPLMKG